jgi:stalled ribosome alternative rescue factor ArfA
MTYYNTTNEVGGTLGEYQKKAKSQEEEIFDYLNRYGLSFSASEIEDSLYKDRNVPITSIRRALSNLNGVKIETVGKIKGKYGRKEFTYRVIEIFRNSSQLNIF